MNHVVNRIELDQPQEVIRQEPHNSDDEQDQPSHSGVQFYHDHHLLPKQGGGRITPAPPFMIKYNLVSMEWQYSNKLILMMINRH
jgi:hypothetical protein